jgi:hypothetical protein
LDGEHAFHPEAEDGGPPPAAVYRRHGHACPRCGRETDFTSDPVEDGEPLHCRACHELGLGGSRDVELCPGCWDS